jgi:hypothetical protein
VHAPLAHRRLLLLLCPPCSTLCDPYLNLFRGIIPPLGGTLDFSPILAFVLLSVSDGTQQHTAPLQYSLKQHSTA